MEQLVNINTSFKSNPVTTKFTPDEGPGKHRIGLVVLSNDYATEQDFISARPNDDVAIFVSRVPNTSDCTLDSLPKMAPFITKATELIVPEGRLDTIAYACTSGTVVMGYETICEKIQAVRPNIPVVTPITASLKALHYLNAKRIAVLTPYEDNINSAIASHLQSSGVEISAFSSFLIEDNEIMAAVPPEAIFEAAIEANRTDSDALFISCTAIRALKVAERIEKEIGKPVITANQAMIWETLRISGYSKPIMGFGQILQQ